MTVQEAIKELQKLSEEGFGKYPLKTYECGCYYCVNFHVVSNPSFEENFIEVH